MPRRRLATLLLTLVLAGVLAPAGALAQSSPFAPLPSPAATPTETVTTSATNSVDDGGLERWQEILIFVGGVILVVGIGWAILHDARRRAPVEDERAFYRSQHDATGGAHKTQRKAKNRAKVKAQRRARRHNR